MSASLYEISRFLRKLYNYEPSIINYILMIISHLSCVKLLTEFNKESKIKYDSCFDYSRTPIKLNNIRFMSGLSETINKNVYCHLPNFIINTDYKIISGKVSEKSKYCVSVYHSEWYLIKFKTLYQNYVMFIHKQIHYCFITTSPEFMIDDFNDLILNKIRIIHPNLKIIYLSIGNNIIYKDHSQLPECKFILESIQLQTTKFML